MRRAAAEHLVGRRIVAVDFRPFSTGRGQGRTTTNPAITLDDGSVLTFDVEETESLDYGVEIMRSAAGDGDEPTAPSLADIIAAAERDAYRDALVRHGGSITEAARELGVDRKTASRAVAKLGPVHWNTEIGVCTYPTLREWLDAIYPHRDPATVGRTGDRRKRVREAVLRGDQRIKDGKGGLTDDWS